MRKSTILLMLTCTFILSISAQSHFKIRSVIQASPDLTNSKWEKLHPVMPLKLKTPPQKPKLLKTKNQNNFFSNTTTKVSAYSKSKNNRDSHMISSDASNPKTSLGENGIYYAIVINHDNNHPHQYLSVLKNTGDPSSSDWTGVLDIHNDNEALSNADIEIVSSDDRGIIIFKQGINTIKSYWFQLSDPLNNNAFATIYTGTAPLYCSITSDEIDYDGTNVYIYATWLDYVGSVKFTKSVDQGTSWNSTVNVAQNLSGLNSYNGNSISYCPSNHKIYISYSVSSASNNDVLVAEQTGTLGDGTFNSTTVMNNCIGSGAIASYGNHILVTSYLTYNGSCDICYVYSDDGGNSWSNTLLFDWYGNQVFPSVSVNDNGYFCLLYCGDTIKARRNIYNNLGGSWSVGTVENVSTSNPTSACLANGTNPDYGGAYRNSLDTYFGWAEEPSITVASPNGGENWQVGSTHDITWDDNISGNVLIELYKGFSYNSTIIGSTPSNGSYSWTIPSGQQPGTDYTIKITSVDNSSIYDFSDGDFEISAQPTPHITLTPDSHDFGSIQVGNSSSEYSFTLTNDGTGTATGTVSLTGSNANQFEITSGGGSFSLSQNQTKTINVKFAPTSEGDKTATLFADGDSPCNDASSALTGTGVQQPTPHIILTPDSHDFGSIQVGNSSSEYSFTLTNDGTGTATGTVSLTGSNANQFEITSGGGSFSLSQNQTKTINVKFAPTSEGDKTATLFADGDSPCNNASSTLFGIGGGSAPVANFEGEPTSLQVGETVQFTDLSTGDPTSWDWTFEGGTPPTSTEQNPLIIYNTIGDYDVSLTATNANGNNTKTKTDYIHVSLNPPPLAAEFVGNPTNIQVGESVNFTDLSIGDPVSWLWTFEGGEPATSNEEHPENIVYNTQGGWDVTLLVTNSNGDESTKTKTDYINVGGINFLQIGNLKVYADNFDNISGSLWEVSGNISINHIIKFSGGNLLVDTDNNTIEGTITCLMHLDNSTGFDPGLPLIVGEFEFEVIGSTLYKTVAGDNEFQMTLLDVPIDEIEVFPDENKIVINGNIILPEIMGHLSVEIDTITLQEGNVDFEGMLEIDTVNIFNTFKLNRLALAFDTYNSNFSGNASMEFYKGTGINAGAVIRQGKLDSIGIRGFGMPPIPIPSTGFQFEDYGGFVDKISNPPLKLGLITNIKPAVSGSFDMVEISDLLLTYTWGTSLEGGGDLLIFNSNVASMNLFLSSNLIRFGGNVTIVPNYEFVLGDMEACLTKYNNNIDLEGSMNARLQIPEDIGFPYGILGGVVIAEIYNYLHNANLYGNLRFLVLKYNYSLEYQNPGISYNFSRGWIDLDKAIFSNTDLIFNPQLEKINKLDGASLLISESHPNTLLTINNGKFAQAFSLQTPSSALVIRLYSNNNPQPFSLVLPDSTIVTPDNFKQIANIEYFVNEDINKTYYLINKPQQGLWTVNMENTSDTLLLDLFSKSVSPTLQLNKTINLNDSVEISWLDSDIDNDAKISLYFDNDNHGANGHRIVDGISENDIVDLYYWNIDSVPTGSYYVYGIIDDSINGPSISYSPNPVKIIDANAPEKPTNLIGLESDTSIFLSWSHPLQDSTIRFNLYYTTDSIYPNYSSSSYNIGTRTEYEFKNFQPGHNYHFMVTAMNTNYIESDHSNIIDITYQSNSFNNAPNILPQNIPDIVYADSTYSYQLLCNDPDTNDVLTYNLYCLFGSDTLIGANTIDINSNGVITWSPTIDDLGYYTIILKVHDLEGASDSSSYNLTVLDPTIANMYVELNNPLYSCFGGSCFVSVKDNTLLNSNKMIDSVSFRVYSNADPVGITLQAVETEPGSNYYRSVFEFSGYSSSNKKLLVDTTDVIIAEYINPTSKDTAIDLSYFGYEPLIVNLAMIGDSVFCAGDEIDVKLVAEPANVAYLWSDGITKTQTIDITEPGCYSVLVSNEFGCIMRSDTIKITPLPTPMVELSNSDTINICEGYELSPGSCEDSCIYNWNTGDTTQTIVINQSGNYNVTVTNTYNCSAFDSVFIDEVHKKPIPEFDYIFDVSNIVNFENKSQYGTVYHWNFGDGYSSIIENPSHMYDENGEYQVMLNVTNNCGSNTIIKTITITDLQENKVASSISIYPNPSNNYINIKFRDFEINEEIEISILNISGITLKKASVKYSTGNVELNINISDLSRGMYYLRINRKHSLITRKIIKL